MSRLSRFALASGAIALFAVAGFAGGLHAQAAAARHAAAGTLPGVQLGSPHSLMEHAFQAYYDAHKDTYVNTDVSNKAQAKSLGINFAPVLAHSLNASSPMYFVKGRAAAGQIAVFGSEPGESDYSPLWQEIWVTWKSGATPVLLKSDNQIFSLAKGGKLTVQKTKIVLNAPVTSVGH
jgi:hypothetical protein